MDGMLKSIGVAFSIAAAGLAAFVATTPSQGASCDRQLVMRIDSATVMAGPDGVKIDAFGVSESAGWSQPSLVVAGPAANGVATLDFMACRPAVSAMVLTPIQTRETVKLDFAKTRRIIIRSKTNSMTVEITKHN
jgi:hypothetical protein